MEEGGREEKRIKEAGKTKSKPSLRRANRKLGRANSIIRVHKSSALYHQTHLLKETSLRSRNPRATKELSGAAGAALKSYWVPVNARLAEGGREGGTADILCKAR